MPILKGYLKTDTSSNKKEKKAKERRITFDDTARNKNGILWRKAYGFSPTAFVIYPTKKPLLLFVTCFPARSTIADKSMYELLKHVTSNFIFSREL